MSYFKQANDLYNSKEYKKAIVMYKKAADKNENEIISIYNTAVCYIKLKNYTDAVNCLKLAILMKKESKYYFNLAYCYAMLNNKPKALTNFNLAWALDNNDTDCEKAIDLILANYKKI